MPKDIRFRTKPEIALEQIRAARAAGLPLGVVLMDAGYGCNTELRSSIGALGLTYVAGILPNTSVWAPGMAPLHPKTWSGRGRPPKLIRRDRNHRPTSVKELALGLPAKAWRKIAWREGSAKQLGLALCPVAYPCCPSRLQSDQEPPGKMAVDRVAKR